MIHYPTSFSYRDSICKTHFKASFLAPQRRKCKLFNLVFNRILTSKFYAVDATFAYEKSWWVASGRRSPSLWRILAWRLVPECDNRGVGQRPEGVPYDDDAAVADCCEGPTPIRTQGRKWWRPRWQFCVSEWVWSEYKRLVLPYFREQFELWISRIHNNTRLRIQQEVT